MKPCILLAAASSCALACVASPPPPNMSNAEVRVTSARQIANTHGTREIQVDPAIRAILDAPDRSADDKRLDERRQVDELFTFFGVKEGMRVVEIAAGAGYATELLARAVGPLGIVYAQNPPRIMERQSLAAAWSERLAKPVNANVLRVDRTFDTPLPTDVRGLDAAYLVFYYGDLRDLGVNRRSMNEAIYRSLKTGGAYVILDRSPRVRGALVNRHALHRAESRNARNEIEDAGFSFVAEGDFLRNSTDPRDWDASPLEEAAIGEPGDRFVLKFVKR
jgi:predicted methyltransferase